MDTKPIHRLTDCLDHISRNRILTFTAIVILLLPVAATTGQYLETGYFLTKTPILLLFWPGMDFEFSFRIQVWLFTGLVFLSYLAGIFYLAKKKSLGKIVLISVFAFIIAGILRMLLTAITGWKESTLGDIHENINGIILSLWHNPLWEEIVFRGIPLLILLLTEHFLIKKRTTAAVLIYLIIPSLLCGLYHIPGHGVIRFFDSFFLSIVFAWMALRFTLFAPLVIHSIADAMLVLNLDKIPMPLPPGIWLNTYGQTLNSIFTLLFLMFIIVVPVLAARYYLKTYRIQALNSESRKTPHRRDP